IVAGNAAVADAPELVNTQPYTAGWLMRIEKRGDQGANGLLSAAEYEKMLADETHSARPGRPYRTRRRTSPTCCRSLAWAPSANYSRKFPLNCSPGPCPGSPWR